MVIILFCPKCENLVYTDYKHNCRCPDYRCRYEGIATTYVQMYTGEIVNLRNITSSTIPMNLDHLIWIIPPYITHYDHIGEAFRLDVKEMISSCSPLKGYRH